MPGSAPGVSTLLLFCYTAAAFGVIVSVTLFGLSVQQASSVASWGWAANALSLVAFGMASDRLGVKQALRAGGRHRRLADHASPASRYLRQSADHPRTSS